MGRLSKWFQLAREVLRVELPQFELVQAFGALRLGTRHEQRELAIFEAERNKQIEQLSKIAQILELDVNDLLAQFFQHLPTAQFVCCRDGCDSIVAWRDAVDAADLCQIHPRQAAETTDVLRKELIRAGAWGISTSSDVERMFGLLRRRQPK